QPAVGTPQAEVELLDAAVQDVTGEQGALRPAGKTEVDRRHVLHVDGTAADVGRLGLDFHDPVAGEVEQQVQPVDAQPDQVAAAGLRLAERPVARALHPDARLVGQGQRPRRIQRAYAALAD